MISRICQIIINLIGVSFLAFLLIHIAPGDPASTMFESAGIIPTQEEIQVAREIMGLDKPFINQYIDWISNYISGDFGESISKRVPVLDLITTRIKATILLSSTSLIIMIIVSIPLGIFAALNKNKFVDKLVSGLNFLGVSAPSFWVGVMFIYIFGFVLNLVPVMSTGFGFDRIILPAITLAIPMAAKYSMQVRTTILEEMNQDYVIGARSRGLSSKKILFRHILPNAMLPLVTMLGLSIGSLLGGTAVIEVIFFYPGIGSLVVDAVSARDYPLIQALVLWIALVYMILNLIVDVSYKFIDPRTRERK